MDFETFINKYSFVKMNGLRKYNKYKKMKYNNNFY